MIIILQTPLAPFTRKHISVVMRACASLRIITLPDTDWGKSIHVSERWHSIQCVNIHFSEDSRMYLLFGISARRWIMFWQLWVQSRGFREADVRRPTIKENSINNIWNPNCLNTSTLQEREESTAYLCTHCWCNYSFFQSDMSKHKCALQSILIRYPMTGPQRCIKYLWCIVPKGTDLCMYFSQSVSCNTSAQSISLCTHFKQVQSFPSWFCSTKNNLSTFCSAHNSLHFSLSLFLQASRVEFPAVSVKWLAFFFLNRA